MFKWLRKTLRRYANAVTGTQFVNSIFGKAPDSSYPALVKRYTSWVYSCTSRNASRVAAVPLRLYATRGPNERAARVQARTLKKHEIKQLVKDNPSLEKSPRFKQAQEIEEIFAHPFLELMQKINDLHSNFETFELTQIYLDLIGNSYWYVSKNNLGLPDAVYPMPAQHMRVVPDKNRFIKGYIYKSPTMATPTPFTPEEIVHFRNPNPNNIYYGLGCLPPTLQAVDAHDAMTEYDAALNRNLGVPSLLIQYDGEMTGDEMQRTEADWNKAIRGVTKSGKIKVADNRFTVHPLAIKPRDMGFVLGRKWTRLEIADAFGVPLALLDTENVNRANAEAANYQYEAFSIKPRLRRISDRMNESLIPMYNEPRLFVAYDNNVPEDNKLLLDRTTALHKENIITTDEARLWWNLPPKDVNNEESNQD